MLKRGAIALIKFYQFFLSPDQGIFRQNKKVCRFYPTCSEYAVQAIEKYGFIKGLGLGIKRVSRCHPWGGSGVDPLT